MSARRPKNGFTLLEIMAALAIMATALVALLGTHLTSLDLAYRHKEQTLAAMLAQQKMGESLTIPFDELSSDSGDFAPDHPEIEWEMEVSDADIENLKEVRVVVRMPDDTFELESLVARTTIERTRIE
jgi:general secretion pathway protein I